MLALLWLTCCLLGLERCTSVKVMALVGVSMSTVLGREETTFKIHFEHSLIENLKEQETSGLIDLSSSN